MQKIITLLTVATLLFSACSKDNKDKNDDKKPSELIVTIGGVKKTFNTIIVAPNDAYEEPAKDIIATINNNPNELIEITLGVGKTGTNALISFRYFDGTNEYFDESINGIPFSMIVQENTGTKIKGTFSGQVARWDNVSDFIKKNMTNGSFEINY